MTSDMHDLRVALLGGALVVLLAVGWFLLSWRVAHTPAGDAFNESPRRPIEDEPSEVDSGSAVLAVAAIAVLAVTWFAVSWIGLGSPVVDAVGEAAGGVVAVLVLVSVFGAVRRSRRPGVSRVHDHEGSGPS
jgi:hypothetical protein